MSELDPRDAGSLLVIAPHGDDEVIGCGGFVLVRARAGARVHCVHVASGFSGVRAGGVSIEERCEVRQREARAAARLLGIADVTFLDEPDRQLGRSQSLLPKLVELIQRIDPDVVLAPHQDDGDEDHEAVARVAREAAWLARDGSYDVRLPPARSLRALLQYEIWHPFWRPDLRVDISAVMSAKLAAVRAYASQVEQVDYVAMAEGLARYRGSVRRVPFAEAFLCRKV